MCVSGLPKAIYGLTDGATQSLHAPPSAPCSHLCLWWIGQGAETQRTVLLANEVFSSRKSSYNPEPLVTEDPGPMRQEEEKVSALTQLPASAGTSAKGQWWWAINYCATCQHSSLRPAIRVSHQALEFQGPLSTHQKRALLQSQVFGSNCTKQFEMLICSWKHLFSHRECRRETPRL